MPGFRVHYLFGKKFLEKNREIKPPARYEKSFNLGLQGPDIFFFSPAAHLFYTPHLGEQMHKSRTGALLSALLREREALTDPTDRRIADAYICGFMGHYTLDSIVHPYVHWRTMRMRNKERANYLFGIHVLLETDMDSAALRRMLRTKPSEFRCADTAAVSRRERRVISRLLSRAISAAYPKSPVPPFGVNFAIFSVLVINAAIHDTSGRKKAFLRRVDQRLVGNAFLSALIATDFHRTYEDPCNLRHRPWRNPWDPSFVSTESVYDLMDRGLTDLERRITLYHRLTAEDGPAHDAAREALLADLGNRSYDSGLAL